MRQIGLGGVHMFTAGRLEEKSKVECLSPAWHEMVRFALTECDRLGLTFSVQNCAGWSGAGGPWITPDKGMFRVVSSRHSVVGGETLRVAAPPSWPKEGDSFYRDIAVLAFPTPAAYKTVTPLPVPKITSSFSNVDCSRLNRQPTPDRATLPTPPVAVGQTAWIQFEFPQAVTCRAVTITGMEEDREVPPDDHRAVVLASDDGWQFRRVCQLSSFLCLPHCADASVPHAIPTTTARYFRLAWDGPATLRLARVAWSSEPTIHSYDSKITETARTLLAEPALPTEPGTFVPSDQIVDLQKYLDPKGNLTWKAPPGAWTVVRLGYRNTNRRVGPAPPEARGLECDKFTRDVVAFHFDHYVGRVVQDARAVGSKAMRSALIDSYEAQMQNWSPGFADEFRKRRGYDPWKYLPAFAGYIVENREITDRFLRDVRQTCSDLVFEVFFGGMAEQSHRHGLQLYAESCGGNGVGTTVADGLQHYLQVDVPMTEEARAPGAPAGRPMKLAVSAAHLSGKKVVAMEAFTEFLANWGDCPATLKVRCDGFFCAGINRLVFHTYAHNPDVDRVLPGPAFWWYGMPFSRGQTWWDMGNAWITYLSRCQFLLERGVPVADVLYFYGEDPAGPIINVFDTKGKNPDRWTALPGGFDYDLASADVLLKNLSVKDGRLVAPDGASYRLLVLRDSDCMTPEAVARIKELTEAGATILGPKPKRSLSLSGYPRCDETVRAIADAVWGDGQPRTQRSCGQGRVFQGMTLAETLLAMKMVPDFSFVGPGRDADLRFVHRRDGDADIYFLSHQGNHPIDVEAAFRLSGKTPEIWDPMTGRAYRPAAFRESDGRTFLPLRFESQGSMFVVFRPPMPDPAAKPKTKMPVLRQTLPLGRPYTVTFSPGWGAPESIEFVTLDDWSKRPEPGIKYYSGTAVYRAEFDWKAAGPKAARLDLGDVAVIAGVKLNGVDCGVAWTSPYRVDISKALKSGRNELEVRVANTWVNRLIGEGRVPGAKLHAWTTYHPFTKESPLARSGLLGPVTIRW
jgi:hypothetical protein